MRFALKRLSKDGLVAVKTDGHIRLTRQGREIAERTIIRHHLIERILSEVLGSQRWHKARAQRQQIAAVFKKVSAKDS